MKNISLSKFPVAFFALAASVALANTAAGCGNKAEPKTPDPGVEESSSGAAGSSSGSSSGGAAGSSSSGSSPMMTLGAVPTSGPESMLEGVRWGMSREDLFRAYCDVGGIIDRDYDGQLQKVSPGIQMRNLESERDALKEAFRKSLIEFNETPTGLDGSALRTEFTYRNKEALLRLPRAGRTRYFFLIGDKLWKIYDEVPLGNPAGLGATYPEAIAKLAAVTGTSSKQVVGADYPTMEWTESSTRVRAVNRSSDRLVGVAFEDKSTLEKLDRLRPNKPKDLFAVDPSIAAATKGGVSDPNAAGTATTASTAKGKGKPPPAPPRK